MEPASVKEEPSPDRVDEPTRVSGELPDLKEVTDEPTRADLPKIEVEDDRVRDYFEEFFNKK